jgi:hypothetical protein
MRTGGLNEILKALLDNNNKAISNQELISLLQKIENDATEIGHAKYGLDEKIKFNIEYDKDPNDNLIGRQSLKSLECIRQSIKKNLELMNENIKTIFQSYLTQCGE